MNTLDFMVPTERGLEGEWSYRFVTMERACDVKSDVDGYPKFITEVLGSRVNHLIFRTDDIMVFKTIVYHMEADLSSWNEKILMLLGPSSKFDIDDRAQHSWYSLGTLENSPRPGDVFKMRRVGSVAATLSRRVFLQRAVHCHGILS
jgi:hypothetical protein